MSVGHLQALVVSQVKLGMIYAPIPKGVTSPRPVTTTLRIACSDGKVVISMPSIGKRRDFDGEATGTRSCHALATCGAQPAAASPEWSASTLPDYSRKLARST